jgi:hypothetical protein
MRVFNIFVKSLAVASLMAASFAPLCASPHKAGAASVMKHRYVDLRPKLSRMKWREGKSVIYSDKAIKLIAEVKGGKVVKLTPVNISGGVIHISRQSGSGSGAGKRPCIICYNLDKVLESTCIEVPCWLVPILGPILNPRTT